MDYIHIRHEGDETLLSDKPTKAPPTRLRELFLGRRLSNAPPFSHFRLAGDTHLEVRGNREGRHSDEGSRIDGIGIKAVKSLQAFTA